jgi:hypothetical protein
MEELIIDYESGALDAAEVRLALAEALNKILKVIFSSYIHPLISPEGKTRPILLVEITRKKCEFWGYITRILALFCCHCSKTFGELICHVVNVQLDLVMLRSYQWVVQP